MSDNTDLVAYLKRENRRLFWREFVFYVACAVGTMIVLMAAVLFMA